jgi:hypothetical protein
MSDDDILEVQATIANAIVAKINDARRQSPVTETIELLLRRIVGAGNSLRVLREHAPHDFASDGVMILRGIYDAMLQALYVLVDSRRWEERARLYLDFYWVEKEKAIHLFDNSQTYLGGRISKSLRRGSVEPAIEQEIQRVRPMFENAKGKIREHWYEGNLRDLANAVGFEAEYELFQKHSSGVVHSSAYALREGMPIRDFLLMDLAWRFSFRVLGKFAEFADVTLNVDERELIRLAENNVFDIAR